MEIQVLRIWVWKDIYFFKLIVDDVLRYFSCFDDDVSEFSYIRGKMANEHTLEQGKLYEEILGMFHTAGGRELGDYDLRDDWKSCGGWSKYDEFEDSFDYF